VHGHGTHIEISVDSAADNTIAHHSVDIIIEVPPVMASTQQADGPFGSEVTSVVVHLSDEGKALRWCRADQRSSGRSEFPQASIRPRVRLGSVDVAACGRRQRGRSGRGKGEIRNEAQGREIGPDVSGGRKTLKSRRLRWNWICQRETREIVERRGTSGSGSQEKCCASGDSVRAAEVTEKRSAGVEDGSKDVGIHDTSKQVTALSLRTQRGADVMVRVPHAKLTLIRIGFTPLLGVVVVDDTFAEVAESMGLRVRDKGRESDHRT
jgi:hypothetical protein